MFMKQKQKFLESEGNGWFQRNINAIEKRNLPEDDPILREIIALPVDTAGGGKVTLLEVGCSNGYKLKWIEGNLHYQCRGIEPSKQAVDMARQKGLEVIQGTADNLPFPDNTFDIVIFGFCLYLCDREDLFRIAFEADRVLKNPGWLLIHDFYCPYPAKNPYHHSSGLFTYKMDYKSMFIWHPAYSCFKHIVFHHEKGDYTDEQNHWVAVSVLRKCLQC